MSLSAVLSQLTILPEVIEILQMFSQHRMAKNENRSGSTYSLTLGALSNHDYCNFKYLIILFCSGAEKTMELRRLLEFEVWRSYKSSG